MKRSLLALVLTVPAIAFADGAPASEASAQLSKRELLSECATTLPKQLACKESFCDAMVDMRRKFQPHFAKVERADLVAGCLKEIAVDGTGSLKKRRARCQRWSKRRPPMRVTRAEADAAAACFEKATCAERIACWAPMMEARMASMGKGKGAPKTAE